MNFHPDLSPEARESERSRFAQWIVDLAAQSGSNSELLRAMQDGLPEGFFKLTGTCSTRRTYSTLLGCSVKMQRESSFFDPLDPEELEFRGGQSFLSELDASRRGSNLAELCVASRYPRLMPKQYGFLAALGWLQKHPSVLVCETARPLSHFLPQETAGVFAEDMGVDADGWLWCFDKRLTSVKKPSHLAPFDFAPKTQLSNLGCTVDGHYVILDAILDAGAVTLPDGILSPFSLAPPAWGWSLSTRPEQDLEFSKELLAKYERAQKGTS